MEVARLLAYLVGMVSAVGVALVLLRTHHGLGKMLAATMGAWAFNCFSFGLMLAGKMLTGETLAWASPLWTVNALLLAIMPVALYVVLWRYNGRNANRH